MLIDKRLKLCADMVSGKGTAVDVGTDHAYLACYLAEDGISEKVIACDINDGPIEAAENTVFKRNLSSSVSVIKSDGLDNISPQNVSDVIIAGMGGELISQILSKAEWLKTNKVNLILQPMTKAPELRIWLYQNGYRIISESACADEQYVYTVINAGYCGESKTISTYEAYIGKLGFETYDEQIYMQKLCIRLEKACDGMKNCGSKISDSEKLHELCRRINQNLKINNTGCKPI